ncbi:MAG: hypothetical protein VW879_16740 [Opitutae bacterium]
MPKLVCFSYKRGSNLVDVQAIVEDAVQIAPATATEPPQFGSALCRAVLVWDDPIYRTNVPTADKIERMLCWIPKNDWYAVPPIFSDDE